MEGLELDARSQIILIYLSQISAKPSLSEAQKVWTDNACDIVVATYFWSELNVIAGEQRGLPLVPNRHSIREEQLRGSIVYSSKRSFVVQISTIGRSCYPNGQIRHAFVI